MGLSKGESKGKLAVDCSLLLLLFTTTESTGASRDFLKCVKAGIISWKALVLEGKKVTPSQRHQRKVYLHPDLLDDRSRKDHHICFLEKKKIKHGYLAATSASDALTPDS